MLLGEPAPTQGDLHFRLFGFPVRVHPFFWLVTLLLGLGGGPADPVEALIWVAVVFVSILVHELGHAVVQRYYGGRPHIVLYGLGGLAICPDCDRSPASQIKISLAGPAAGFLFAAVIMLGLRLAGRWVALLLAGHALVLGPEGVHWRELGHFVLITGVAQPFEAHWATVATHDLLFVNILWGVVNLLPVYPLDGGRVARELFTLGDPRRGIIQSLQLSIGTAVLVAVYALYLSSIYVGVMFGLLAYSSYQALAAYQSRWR